MAFFTLLAIFAVSAGVAYSGIQSAKKAAKAAADSMAGVLVNKESNIEPIPVIYGERRVGGVRVFVSTKDVSGGDKNEYLYIALAMAEGEVESITDIYIDDTPITDSKFTGLYTINVHTGADNQAYDPLLTEANAGWSSGHKLSGIAYLAIKLKWDQDAFGGVPDITAVVKGRKVYDPSSGNTAYSNNPALCIRDYLTNNRYGKGLPASAIDDTAFISAAADCEQSVTFYANGTTGKIFECNAVLQTDETLFDNIKTMLGGCRGFLPYNQGRYSLIIDKARSSVFAFDKETIIDGITIKGESKEDKFNRVIVKFANPDVDYQPDQAVWPDSGSTEEATFLAEDNGTLLVEDLSLDTVTNYYAARDLARVLLKRSRNALRTSFKATSEALQLSVGDVVTVTHETPAWVAKPFQVEEITLDYDGTCNVSLLEYDPSIYTYDLSAEQKSYPDTALPNPFSVAPPTALVATSTTVVADDGTLLPSLRLNWTKSADSFVNRYEVQYQRGAAIIDLGSIADNYDASENYGLITVAASILLDYGSIDEEVPIDEPDYNSTFVTTTQYIMKSVTPSSNYNIRIRAVNDLGVRSNWVTISGLAEGDTDAPAIPDSVTAAGGLKEITLSWVPPTDPDYSHVEVWENAVNNFATASKVAVGGGDSYTRTGIGYNVLKYYWLKAVDYSGNISDESSVASATTLFVDTDSFSQAVNDLFSESGAYGIEPVSSLPASGDFNGQIKYHTTENKLYRWDSATSAWTDDIFSIESGTVDAASFASGIEPISILTALPNPSGYTGPKLVFLTTDNKIYRYTGSAWTSEIPAADVAGVFASANFPNDLRPIEIVTALPTTGNFQGRQVFLTTDNKTYRYDGTAFIATIATTDLQGTIASTQLASAAVTNAKIAVNAIQGDVIAAGAITAAKILDGAISELKLANDAVTNAKIATDAITADVIAAGAITSDAITAGAITSLKLADDAVTNAKIAVDAVQGDVIAANAITADKLLDGAVSELKIATDAVTTAKIAVDAITADVIAAGAITETKIATDAVTNAKIAIDAVQGDVIAAGAITENKIGAAAITTAKIATDAITADVIAAGAITETKIGAAAITTAKLANDAVTSDIIAAAAITETKIASDSITTAKIAADAITADQLAADSVTANSIIANAITSAKIDTGAVTADSIAANSITTAKIAADAITADEIAADAVTANAIIANAITTSKIAAGAITADEIAANAITTAKIAADAITADQIAADAVTADSIAANTITAAKIATGAITADEIAANAITSEKIAANTITADNIAADAITASELAADSVTAVKIAAGAVVTDSLAADSITTAKIAAGAITAEEIAAAAITTGKIAAGAVTADEISANAITSGKIAADTIVAADIAADAITATELSAGSVTTAKLDAAAITSEKIAAGAITADTIAANAITSAKIQAGAVVADSIAADAITTAKIAAGAITADEISAAAITAGKIAADAVTATEIAANSITAGKIAADAVTADSIASDSITSIKIAAGAITADEIATGAVTADSISAGSITTAAIAADAITANLIAADAITADKISADAITADKIAANAITSDKIDANAITAGKIQAGAVGADAIAANSITAGLIAADAITTDKIAANSITAGLIAAAGVITDTAQISDAVITAANISNLAVTSAKISSLAVTSGKIASLAVDTFQIRGNAVTIPSGSTTTAPAYTEWGSGSTETINGSSYYVPVLNSVAQWRTISSITFTSAGGNVFLTFSGELAAGVYTNDQESTLGRTNIQFQILRDATVIQTGFIKGNYVPIYSSLTLSLNLNRMIDNYGNAISVSALDSTTVGSHTWSLRARPILQEANYDDFVAANRNFSVSALEVKK